MLAALRQRPLEQPPRASAARPFRIGPVAGRCSQEALVEQEVLARETRQRLAQRLGGPQQQAYRLLAVAAQRMRRRAVFGKPPPHRLDVGSSSDLPVSTSRPI